MPEPQKQSAVTAGDFKMFFKALANSYSDIFFIHRTFCGVLLLVLTLINYNAGLSGIFAVFSAYLTARFLGHHKPFIDAGYYAYNALLVGLAIGFVFKISFLSLLMLGMAGALTYFITLVTANIFQNLFNLQVLSIPFIIVSSLVYLSASSFTNLYVISLYTPMFSLDLGIFPYWFSGYLKSLGAIMFMPNEISGLLIALLLLYYSRILFFLSLAGFLTGMTIYGFFTGSVVAASQDISSFNYILIAMAIGGIFAIPSLNSTLIALIGVAVSTLISSAGHVFWSQYGLPIFTLPFTLVTLSLIYTFYLLNYPNRTVFFIGNPEQNLDYFIANKSRFVTTPYALSMPFSGNWYVWQGFDDKWTHQGLYKYAYDFVIADDNGKTCANQGNYLNEYYCYGQDILSPVNGKVVRVVNYLPDNIIGSVDTINPWGNEIIIQDDRGFYVRLAHLAAESIMVFEGQAVSVGTALAKCGNSGNSPQPHLHIQIQSSTFPTAPTMPFVFVNYAQSGHFITHGLPETNLSVCACAFNLFYDQVTNFVLDDVYHYQVYKNDRQVDSFSFTVKMSATLYTYFETTKGRLYFGKQYGNYYCYSIEGDDPYLKLIYLALSTLPISYTGHYDWTDTINNSSLLDKPRQFISSLLNTINHEWINTQARYYFETDTLVKGQIRNSFFDIQLDTEVELDPVLKFKEIRVGDYRLVNTGNESLETNNEVKEAFSNE